MYNVLAAGDRDALRHAIALSGLVHLASSVSIDESYQSISQEVTSINVSGDPAHGIVQAGTNNLPTDSAHRCAEKIVDLAKSVMLKFPNSRIAVCALTHREDLDLSAKLHDVNENLKSLSGSNNFTFIDSSIIDNSCLLYTSPSPRDA